MNVTKSFTQFCNMWNLPLITITHEHLNRGTGVGKILRREILKARPDYAAKDMVSFFNQLVQCGVEAWNAKQYVDKICITNDVDLIAAIYNDTHIHSCMTGEGNKLAEFYVANGFRLAYMKNEHGDATARCLIQGNEFNETYGPSSNQLEVALQELGMKSTERLFHPGTLLKLPNQYLPYLDNWVHYLIRVDEETLLTTEIMSIDLDEPSYDNDYLQDTLEALRKLVGEGYEYAVQSVQESTMTSAGDVHYTLLPCADVELLYIVDTLEKIIAEDSAVEEPRYWWNLLRVSGRMFWLQYRSDGHCERYFMDNYGNVQNARFAPAYIVKEEIVLGEFGEF